MNINSTNLTVFRNILWEIYLSTLTLHTGFHYLSRLPSNPILGINLISSIAQSPLVGLPNPSVIN